MSMFIGLRGMAYMPVESLETGGFLWITDLTMSDPYCILPMVTGCTTFLQLKFSADGMNMLSVGPIAKKFIKVMPILLVPITMNFPAVRIILS